MGVLTAVPRVTDLACVIVQDQMAFLDMPIERPVSQPCR